MSAGARPRILVTRSEPGAQETAQRLVARGYDPVVESAFALVRLATVIPAFDALAFTSANGVRMFADLSARRDAPVFCVGARTADAAREAGFSDIASADGDVAALAGLVRTKLGATARLLHTGNEDTRGDLAGALTRAGHAAHFVATYRAEPAARPGPALAAHLAGRERLDAALVHSPAGAAVLDAFFSAAPGAPPLPVAAISAAAAPSRVIAPVEVAETPTEASLLAALDLIFRRA